jgi:DNA-binding SARP family transcriptional activator
LRRDGPVTATLQQVVLAVLLLDTGRPVGIDRLITMAWPHGEPRTARVTIQNYIRRLRVLLDRAGSRAQNSLIATLSNGYMLSASPDQVDLFRVHDLLHRARAAVSQGDPVRGRTLLRSALAEWRGDPLPEFSGTSLLDAERTQLGDLHASVVEEWAALELVTGRSGLLTEPLTELVRHSPLRESAQALLVRALHASGRTADALAQFRHARALLVDELGAEPGGLLVAAHQEALDGGDHSTAPETSGASSAAPVPAQLPVALACFAGRNEELSLLDDLLAARRRNAGTSPSSIAVVSGAAGVGKTTLAVQWAHDASQHFPDGQLYVNLRGFEPASAPLHPSDVLHSMLVALGIPQGRIPLSIEERSGLYRSVLANRRVLALLDNARDVEQVRPLIPGAGGCYTVITSRSSLVTLAAREGASQVVLDLMTRSDATELLINRLGRSRVEEQQREVVEIIERCARLPLALGLAGAKAAARPEIPLQHLVEQLRQASPLEALRSGTVEDDIHEVFSWSVQALSPPAARLFKVIGQLLGPDFTVSALASAAGLDYVETQLTLDELVDASLTTPSPTQRYTCHDLLRIHARGLAEQPGSENSCDDVARRLLDHYLHSAAQAVRQLYGPGYHVPMDQPADGVVVEPLNDRKSAHTWLTGEHATLLTLVRQAGDRAGFEGYSWRLARVLARYFSTSGHLDAMERMYRAVLEGSASRADATGTGARPSRPELGVRQPRQCQRGRTSRARGTEVVRPAGRSDLAGQDIHHTRVGTGPTRRSRGGIRARPASTGDHGVRPRPRRNGWGSEQHGLAAHHAGAARLSHR